MDRPRSRTAAHVQLPSATGRSASRRTRRRRTLLAAGLAVATAAGLHAAPGGLAAERTPGPSSEPVTFLLAGLDKRAGLTKQQKDELHVGGKACDCTDVMMLVQVSADRDRVSVVSIPRDSYVQFAPHAEPERVRKETGAAKDGGGRDAQNAPSGGLTEHYGKINAAHLHGGPELTVRTVERATGLRIDHYLETDFTGFAKTVDRLGGSRVCTDKPLKDANSGLDLAEGSHRLDGKQALRYVRARHIPPSSGDLGRVRRQQRLVAEMLGDLTSGRVAGNPVALVDAARSLAGTVRTDGSLSLGRLVSLGRALRALPDDAAEFATVPIAEFDYRAPHWGSSLLWDRPRAAAMFAALREDRPLRDEPRIQPPPGVAPVALPPSEVPVRVEGSGDRADRLETGLRDDGFAVAERRAGEPASTQRPVVLYAPHYERDAHVLATALPGAELRPRKDHGRTLTVLPGSGPVTVAKVVHDRSSVEGAPVGAEQLQCAEEEPAGGRES
ncbi:LCP family protein [Streptomyces xiaopingdaonensis]|uniref:LCP family protein n=1 Tax=Streptomyces xiaopingdaonensis TaxID=1565415 RepID=UPI0002D38C44|nr:LCP family protein [Streptomyces xiaopingdaonensis]